MGSYLFLIGSLKHVMQHARTIPEIQIEPDGSIEPERIVTLNLFPWLVLVDREGEEQIYRGKSLTDGYPGYY